MLVVRKQIFYFNLISTPHISIFNKKYIFKILKSNEDFIKLKKEKQKK